MQIETVRMEDTKARLILKDATPALANALRRTMLQDIPKMAIDHVDFHLGPIMDDETDKEYESVTSLFDEIIASRLGLVPIPTDYSQFTYRDQCECGGVGCPHCSIMYSLNKHGPSTVLSGDMIPLGDSSLKVKDEFIPIVQLTGDQAVLIYASAVMGTAKKHVKWQAAFGVGYSYMPIIKIDDNKASDPEVIAAAMERFPGVFDEKDGKLVVADLWRACGYGREPFADVPHVLKGFATMEWDDTSYLFKYETDGSLTAQQVLDKALEILVDEAQGVADMIGSLA